MNKNIFLNPEELMENVVGVTSWLNKKIQENGGDPEKRNFEYCFYKDGKSFA